MEIGVNLLLPFNPKKATDSLICYKGKRFAPMNSTGRDSIGEKCSFQRYEIKIYNKRIMSGGQNILRVELKVVRMEHLKKAGFKTLADLTRKAKIKKSKKFLIDILDNTIFDDNSVDESKLNNWEKDIFLNGRNPRFWEEIIKKPSLCFKKKAQFRKIVKQYGKEGIQPMIKGMFNNKWEELLNENPHLESASKV